LGQSRRLRIGGEKRPQKEQMREGTGQPTEEGKREGTPFGRGGLFVESPTPTERMRRRSKNKLPTGVKEDAARVAWKKERRGGGGRGKKNRDPKGLRKR